MTHPTDIRTAIQPTNIRRTYANAITSAHVKMTPRASQIQTAQMVNTAPPAAILDWVVASATSGRLRTRSTTSLLFFFFLLATSGEWRRFDPWDWVLGSGIRVLLRSSSPFT